MKALGKVTRRALAGVTPVTAVQVRVAERGADGGDADGVTSFVEQINSRWRHNPRVG